MSDSEMMPSTLDREIINVSQDAFGHRHFAKALRSLIESSKHQTPFSIGLLGGWGTGKSSIKELYIAELRDDATKTDGLTRSHRFRCITFNAWRFGGKDQDIKRALLRHVFRELGGSEDNLQDRLFRQVTETKEIQKTWLESTCSYLKAWAQPIPALIFAMLLLFCLIWGAMFLAPKDAILLRTAIVLGVSWVYTYLLKHLKPADVKLGHPVTKVAFPSTTPEQFEDMLLDQVSLYKKGKCKDLDGNSGKTCERIVVFVDDLDRLSAEEMISGLDAVRTFMEIPKARLPDGLGLVFVISCDEAKIADALAKGRRSPDLPATVFNHIDARRFLDRVFQFRLEIPPPPRHDMRAFAMGHLERMIDLANDLKSRKVLLAPIVDRMIHVGVQDPRNALQIVNAFAQAWWLGKQRERDGAGTSLVGGLHEGAVTNHPISLGALCAMKVSFPDFYRDLQDNHALLHCATDVIVNERSLEDMPLVTQQLLREKYVREVVGETGKYEVRPEHRALRQFLASLVGLRWPASLQSLLLLSEDPVTRHHGSNAIEIYNAFVSGDSRGVLEGMGRHNDAVSLSEVQARLLYQMFEDLRFESVTRRVSAARVIAELINRLPEPPAAQLLGALSREIADSRDLRSQLGPQRLEKILESCDAKDQKSIASQLVGDIFVCRQQFLLARESLESPSLAEAVDMVKVLAPRVLKVFVTHGLETKFQASLMEWLTDRTIILKDVSQQLPFDQLEVWLESDKEDGPIAEELGFKYILALADELEKKEPAQLDLTLPVKRVARILEAKFALGEESRRPLWELVTRLVGLTNFEVAQVAWQFAVPRLNSANNHEVSKFISTFALAIETVEMMEPYDKRWRAVETPFVAAVTANINRLDSDATEAIAKMAIHWSDYVNADDACSLLICLRTVNEPQAARVVDAWAKSLLGDLKNKCVELLAQLIPKIPESSLAIAVNALNPVVANEQVAEEVVKSFKVFVENVPAEGWQLAHLRNYLDQLIQQVAARFANPSQYLTRLFPIVSKILRYGTPSIVGSSLQNLFTQAKTQPAHYSFLHSCMRTNWPAETEFYNPVTIFDETVTFAATYPNETRAGLVHSLADMVNRKLVPVDRKLKLLEVACNVWKSMPNDIEPIFQQHPGLSSRQIADLHTTINMEDQDQIQVLQKVWGGVSRGLTEGALIETTLMVLGTGSKSADGNVDLGLRTWLQAQSDGGVALTRALLKDPNLNDEFRKRVWYQAIGQKENLGVDFFTEVIPFILCMPSADSSISAIFDNWSQLGGLWSNEDLRANLARTLMSVFIVAPSLTTKNRIAEYCNHLVGQAALKVFTSQDTLSKDEHDILQLHFGKGSEVRRLEKILEVKD